MHLVGEEQANRRKAVNQAVANVQAHGITPHLAVLALYERYVRGELSLAQVGELMQHRATAILATAPPAQSGWFNCTAVAERDLKAAG